MRFCLKAPHVAKYIGSRGPPPRYVDAGEQQAVKARHRATRPLGMLLTFDGNSVPRSARVISLSSNRANPLDSRYKTTRASHAVER